MLFRSVPLDDSGRVVPEGRVDTRRRIPVEWTVVPEGRVDMRWRIPAEWKTGIDDESRQQQAIDKGWEVNELDMTLNDPVRGDSCARITRNDPEGFVRLLVCANIGMVELESSPSEEIRRESWKLVEIERGR